MRAPFNVLTSPPTTEPMTELFSRTTHLRRLAVPLVAIALAGLLQACAAAVATGGATAVSAAADERGIGGVVSDADIRAGIARRYFERQVDELYRPVHIQVNQGRVLLTGRVATQTWKSEAVSIARGVPGVTQVMDEIRVVGEGDLGDYARDTWLTTKVRAALLADEAVNSFNYNIEVSGAVVYLIGLAASDAEHARAVEIARGISGVKRVVSYVEVKRPGAGG